MENQNKSIIINMICILLIIISGTGIINNSAQIYKYDFLKSYHIVYFGSDFAETMKIIPYIKLFFLFIYSIAAILTFKRSDIGRRIVLIMTLVWLGMIYAQHFLWYFVGNNTVKYGILGNLTLPSGYVLLYIAIIYILTRPDIKEMFGQKCNDPH